jgi:hypothetical protein
MATTPDDVWKEAIKRTGAACPYWPLVCDMAQAIKVARIQAAARRLSAMPAIPDDYQSDNHWS